MIFKKEERMKKIFNITIKSVLLIKQLFPRIDNDFFKDGENLITIIKIFIFT